MVEASPSALFDSTHQVASGLPSMIQDGSIGRGVKSTVVLAISINVRDIENLKQSEVFAGRGLQSSGRNLSFPYELRRIRPQHASERRNSRPFAPAEYGDAAAVGMDAVDIGLVRTDHPVDVDQALVAALGCDLLRRELCTVNKAFRIALAERDVARRVLVEQ